jgi:hypothetical protein
LLTYQDKSLNGVTEVVVVCCMNHTEYTKHCADKMQGFSVKASGMCNYHWSLKNTSGLPFHTLCERSVVLYLLKQTWTHDKEHFENRTAYLITIFTKGSKFKQKYDLVLVQTTPVQRQCLYSAKRKDGSVTNCKGRMRSHSFVF